MAIVEDQISFARVEDGEDGRGIKGTPVSTYAQSTSGTTPPTTWSDTRPNVPAGQYLWTRVVTTYTDDTTSETQTPTLMGKEGTPGLGIKSKSISYAIGTSGNTPPTSGWQESIPNVSANQYLWTKTTLVYTDDSKTEAYSVGKMGANGADAKLLYITASAENMVFNADDTPKTTQTINITAKLQNVTGTATFAAIPYIGNTAQAAITLGGSGNTRTLTSAQWTNKNWTLIAITATLDNLSDTLSIVKVKDGKEGEDGQDAHIYQAYSWSPEGTDRFATTYPNENLFSGDVAVQTYSSVSSNNASTYPITKEIRTESNFYFSRIRRSNPTQNPKVFSIFNGINLPEDFAAKLAGKKVTLSLLARGTSNVKMNLMARCVSATGTSALPGDYQVVNIGTGWTVVSLIVNSFPTDVQTLRFIPYSIIDPIPDLSQFFLDLSRWKIEFGDGTIYTPSPEDDFINAYPSYIGTYTTFDDVQSTNPADYTWQRMLGLSGEDGKDGEQGPQGVPGPKGDNGQTYYTWLKYADTPTSGMSDSPTGKTYIGLAYNKATATESTNYADYTWSLIKGSDGAQGPKGDNGQTLYTWIKYATSATGAGMSDSPSGKTYIGLAYNKTTATESTNAADYSWSLIKGDKGDTGPTGPQGPQGPTGPKGDRGIMGVAYMQPTQPSDTTEGATWFQTESATSDKIIGVYTYKSGWQQKKYASATLSVESLEAISANLGDITAGSIAGVSIKGSGIFSDYDRANVSGATVWTKGTLSMSDGKFRNDFKEYTKSSGAVSRNGFSEFIHEALTMASFNGTQTTTADRYLQITPFRINMIDSQGRGGNLTFQDLYSIGKTGIPAASGWSQYSTSPSSGNFPSATRLGRMVQVSGAFKNNSTLPNTNNTYVVGVLPVGFRPQMQVKYLGKGAGTTIFMVTIDTNGEISISYRLGWTGSSFGYLTNNANDIFNIAGVFSAADV